MRDPRWGEHKKSGEDPTLTSEYAVNLVKATQYGEEDTVYDAASTVKHFSLYDLKVTFLVTMGHCHLDTVIIKGERFNSDSIPPKADFIDYFLVPFKAAIQ